MMQGDENTLAEVAKSSRENASTNVVFVYIFIILLVLALAALFIYYKFLREPMKRNQRRKQIFNRFSAANELNGQENNHLKQIALRYQLSNPYLIFVKRSVFEDAAGRISQSGVEIGRLRDKLYRPE